MGWGSARPGYSSALTRVRLVVHRRVLHLSRVLHGVNGAGLLRHLELMRVGTTVVLGRTTVHRTGRSVRVHGARRAVRHVQLRRRERLRDTTAATHRYDTTHHERQPQNEKGGGGLKKVRVARGSYRAGDSAIHCAAATRGRL